MPTQFWCDRDGIWDCPDGSDEAYCGKVSKSVNINDIKERVEKIEENLPTEQVTGVQE